MRRFRSVLVLIGATCCLNTAFAADSWQGRKLVELLDDLNARGYQIIFSSDVVTGDMRLADEPDLSDPIIGLRPSLQALGLALERGPGNSWLVRRDATSRGEATGPAPANTPLPEIVVTSSLHRLEYREPATQTYLDRELATRVPAAAEEAVRITNRLPGTASGGISARNHIRGGEANEILFLLDGLRLYEPFHLKDFQTVATIVNSNAIDGIDFYSGAYPAQFGDRMSGVMSMSLREPAKTRETELALSFFNASALSTGRFGGADQGEWLVALRRGNLDLIADVINPELGSPDYQDYLLHGGWEFGPRLQLSANALISKDKLTLADVDRGERARADYENNVLWFKWLAEWSEDLRSETIVSFSTISNSRSGTLLLPQIVSGALDDRRDFDAVGLKQDWTWLASPHWLFSFGVDGKHQDARYEFVSSQSIAAPFDSILDNSAVEIRDFDERPEGAQYGIYAEARWQLRPDLVVDAGLRWDRQSYTDARSDEQVSPRVGILYQVGNDTELRLGWGQYSQAQEINELQVSDGISNFYPAQRAEHFVANFKHRYSDEISIDASWFRKSFRKLRPRFENAFNSLTLLPELQFDRYQIDPDSAYVQGAELLVSRGDGTAPRFWWIGYAWSEVRDDVMSRSIRRSWDQAHALKAGMSWRWGKWDFSAAGEVHTGWPKTELQPGAITNPDGSTSLTLSVSDLNSRRYSVFHTLDARVSREFDVRRGDLTVFLEVSNLYNRDNECCIEYSVVDGVNGAELRSRHAHWLPLVPSLGVIWRF